jgi:hypothetical protein
LCGIKEKNIMTSNTKIQKDTNMDIKKNSVTPNHGYDISNEQSTEDQMKCITESLPKKVSEQSNQENPDLRYISESETSQNNAIVIMEVTFELKSAEHKSKKNIA